MAPANPNPQAIFAPPPPTAPPLATNVGGMGAGVPPVVHAPLAPQQGMGMGMGGMAGVGAVNAGGGPLRVAINGNMVNLPDQQPIIVAGRPHIPVYHVFTALGFNVTWNPTFTTATMVSGNITMIVNNESTVFTVNGNPHFLPSPVFITENDRMVASFAELIESIGGVAVMDVNNILHIFI
jgi:hypothetical protein